MKWDGEGWGGLSWDGMGWDGVGWGGEGWDRVGLVLGHAWWGWVEIGVRQGTTDFHARPSMRYACRRGLTMPQRVLLATCCLTTDYGPPARYCSWITTHCLLPATLTTCCRLLYCKLLSYMHGEYPLGVACHEAKWGKSY